MGWDMTHQTGFMVEVGGDAGGILLHGERELAAMKFPATGKDMKVTVPFDVE